MPEITRNSNKLQQQYALLCTVVGVVLAFVADARFGRAIIKTWLVLHVS